MHGRNDFRAAPHTFVALWIAAGANPKEVSVRAGHSSVALTLDRHGHLYEDLQDEIPDRLDTHCCRSARVPNASQIGRHAMREKGTLRLTCSFDGGPNGI